MISHSARSSVIFFLPLLMLSLVGCKTVNNFSGSPTPTVVQGGEMEDDATLKLVLGMDKENYSQDDPIQAECMLTNISAPSGHSPGCGFFPQI